MNQLGGRTFIVGIVFLLATTYQIWLAMVAGADLAAMGLTIGTEAGGVFAIIAGNVKSAQMIQPAEFSSKGWRKLVLGILYILCATFIVKIAIDLKIAQPSLSAAMVSQVGGLGVVVWGNIKEKVGSTDSVQGS
jgi:predicted CDP-diglyceride synthetase/phosphatidate cytidylyltransferase